MSNSPTDPVDPDRMETMKSPDLSNLNYDFKQDLSHYPELNIKYEESNKMYVCHLCDFRTAFRNSLLNHQAVHSDYRPWVCAMCDYAAKRKQDLKKHLHTIHGLMVESTMLRPVGTAGNGNIMPRNLNRGESSEDSSRESSKLTKLPEADTQIPGSHFFPTGMDSSKVISAMNLQQTIKEEHPDKSSPSSSHRALPTMPDHIEGSPPESPDYDLPITFPSASRPSSSSFINETPTAAAAHESFPDVYAKMASGTEFSQSNNLGPQARHATENSESDSERGKHFATSAIPSAYAKKRPHSYLQDNMDSHKSRDQSAPPPNKSQKTVDSDDFPCSSSVSVSHARCSQTQTSFLCEHCDIMFFQRAMYLMHAGLHSADNPWCCTVCGGVFTEKYSFTSHFINQH